MAKTVFRFATAVAVLALFVSAASADHELKKKKRKGFFENLFGTHSGKRKSGSERFVVWGPDGNPRYFNSDGEPFLFGRSKRQFADIDYGDPEEVPGLGMGNIEYVLPRLPAVFEASLAQRKGDTPETDAVRLVLADKGTSLKAQQAIRDAVINHYTNTSFRPIWLKNGKLTARAMDIVNTLKASADDGLEPNSYMPPVLVSYDDIDTQIEGSTLAAAQFDVGLTIGILAYARHISGGVFDPGKLSLYHDIKPESAEPKAALGVLAWSPYPLQYLAGLVPKHPAYALFKDELRRLSATQNDAPAPFPTGKRVKVGQKDPRVGALRDRLQKLGVADLAIYQVAEDKLAEDKRNTLDKALSGALKSFQQSAEIPQSGALDQATVNAFNRDSQALNREKLLTNMERIRWLPKAMAARHVFVNQAAYEVDVMDGGKAVWHSKVIVGKPLTQTAVFNDEMETVVFNPSWGVPQSIIINEYLPKARRDPGYLDRIGFKVINRNGKVVSSRSVNWDAVGLKSGIGIQQPPGNGNALGEIKFLFPNAHSIYMHDTPNRELFAETRRNFSHGCVRVENPREFAEVLLGWERARIDEKVESGQSQSVNLPVKVPVHIAYFTAWPDENGKIRYFPDAYERDSTIVRGRNIISKAILAKSGVKIVQSSTTPTELAAD